MPRLWLALGSLSGLLAVALSALAAHGLPLPDDSARRAIDSALTMQGWHALALLATGLWADRRGGVLTALAGAAFALGSLLFCGAVWMAVVAPPAPAGVAPAGGILLMAGWALLAASTLKRV